MADEASQEVTASLRPEPPERSVKFRLPSIKMGIEKPTLRVGKVENETIQLDWDFVQGGKIYEIIRVKGEEMDVLDTTENKSYSIRGVAPGKEFSFCVRVKGGKVSNKVTAMTGPPAPENVTAVVHPSYGWKSVSVTFEERHKTPTCYEVVMVDLSDGSESTKETNETFVIFSNLEPGRLYGCYVRSVDSNTFPSGPEKLYSRKSYVPHVVQTCPGKVMDVAAEYVGGGVAKIRWNSPEGSTDYEVVLRGGDNVTEQLYSTNEATVQNLVLGRPYTVTVSARNASGRGPFSDAKEIHTEPQPPCGMKVSHFHGSEDTKLLVSVEEPSPTGATEVTFTAKSVGVGEEDKTVSSSSGYAVIENLTRGEAYKISAVARQGSLQSSETVYNDLVHMYPMQPTNLKATLHGEILHVSWDPCKSTGYQVEITVNGDVSACTTTTNNMVKKDLQPSSVYQIRVAGVNAAGCGTYSSQETFYTAPEPPTSPRMQHNPEAVTTSVVVSFKDSEAVTKRYRIIAVPIGGGEKIEMNTLEKQAILSGLTPGESYSVCVVAFIEFGEGQIRQSEEVYCLPM